MNCSSSGVTQRLSFFFPWARIFAAWRATRTAFADMICFPVFGRVGMVLIPSSLQKKETLMGAKFRFLVVLSSLFLFSACAEVKISTISQESIKQLSGRWDLSGYSAFPHCIAQFSGTLLIHKNGGTELRGGNNCFQTGSNSVVEHGSFPIFIKGSVLEIDPKGTGRIKWTTGPGQFNEVQFQWIKKAHCVQIIKLDGMFNEFNISYHWVGVPFLPAMSP